MEVVEKESELCVPGQHPVCDQRTKAEMPETRFSVPSSPFFSFELASSTSVLSNYTNVGKSKDPGRH